ncbi:MAG: SBBP repeat-containing protein [Candidatus Sumerlaeota bacterium]|nr:SBBP repeat-containing protein [Candidatus Sumerlaeota bacterium]
MKHKYYLHVLLFLTPFLSWAIQNGDFHDGGDHWQRVSSGNAGIVFHTAQDPVSYAYICAFCPMFPPPYGGGTEDIYQEETSFTLGQVYKATYRIRVDGGPGGRSTLGWGAPLYGDSQYTINLYDTGGTITECKLYCDDPAYKSIGMQVSAQNYPADAIDAYIYEIKTEVAMTLPSGLHRGTYLGGREADTGKCIAIDKQGNIYVGGITDSDSDFPVTPGAYDTSFNGNSQYSDIFIAKFDPTLSHILACTYLGSASTDDVVSIKVDNDGHVYILGTTQGSDFPLTPNAIDTPSSSTEIVVSIMNSSLSTLLFSTYLGGSAPDGATAMVLDEQNNIYITGWTNSSDFPVTSNAYKTTLTYWDSFICKIDTSQYKLVYSTYLGGVETDTAYDIAVDSNHNAYVTGATYSADFPATLGAYDTTYEGSSSVSESFVACLNAAGNALLYSTYVPQGFESHTIALDNDGNVCLGILEGSYITTRYIDVVKFNPTLDRLLLSKRISKTNDDEFDMIVDDNGFSYITGTTEFKDFPVTPDAFDRTFDDETYSKGFMSCVDMNTGDLLYSTFLGGPLANECGAIAMDENRNVYLTGWTDSMLFPRTLGAFDIIKNGSGDAFVFKLPRMLIFSAAHSWNLYE